MKRKQLIFIFIVFFSSLLYAREEKEGMIFQKFTLHPDTSGDGYALFFPVEVTDPGKMKIYVHVKKGEKNKKIDVILVDVRAFEDKDGKKDKDILQMFIDLEYEYAPIKLLTIKNLNKTFNSLKKTIKHWLGQKEKPPKWLKARDKSSLGHNAIIEHTIDDEERLVTEGKYVVILKNYNDEKIEGQILIEFPGEMFEVERDLWEEIPNKADLLIKDIFVGRGNKVVVILSKDKGFMPDALWKQKGDKAVILRVTVGETIFEAKLPEFDPKRKLKYGELNYTLPDISITAETRVTAFIDATNQVAERSKANNKKTVVLIPKEQ